jgi:DNA-binding MarR family transcriptional regulator
MEERERIIREVIKVLPDLAKSLNRDAGMHAVARNDRTCGAPGVPISTAQVRTLVHLAQYGPQTMGELAEGMRITTASATGLIKPLFAAGLVERARDLEDRRVVRVRLSPKAQELADRVLTGWRREVEAALAGMDDQACAHFLEGLERLAGKRG